MPVCAGYLGLPGFGVWAAVTSVLGLMAFADLGIGNGVLNLLSAARGRDDDASLRRILATALALLTLIAVALFVMFLLLYPWIDWHRLFGAADAVPAGQVAGAVSVLAVVLALSIPSTVIQRLQFALQAGYLNGISQAAGGVLALLLMLLVSRTDLGLPGMVGATLAAPLLTLWGSGLWLFNTSPKWLPTAADVDRAEMPAILRSGGQFLLLGLVFCLCQASDSVLIANLLGAEQAGVYAVHQKYVMPISFIGGLALTPLWAAYAEAVARGDRDWVRWAFKRSLLLTMGAGVLLSVLLMLMLQPALTFWMKGRVSPDFWVATALLGWVSIELVGKTVSIFLHGTGQVAQQIWIALVFLPLCLGAKVIGALHFGVPGVVVGTTLAYVVAHAWPYWRLIRQWHAEAAALATSAKARKP